MPASSTPPPSDLPLDQVVLGRMARITAPLGEFRPYLLFRKGLRRPLAPFVAAAHVEIGVASEADLVAAAEMTGEASVRLPVFRDRAGRGQRCFVARAGGEVVGYNWLAFHEERDGHFVMRVRDEEVYCLDAFTHRDWRGRGIHPALLHAMLVHARDEGYATAFTQVGAVNRRSSKAHRRLGWSLTGVVAFVHTGRTGRPRVVTLRGSSYPIAAIASGGAM